MPCRRRRNMTSWNGRSSPAAASYATISPSTIASRVAQAGAQQRHHVRELGAHPLLPPGEQLDLAVGGAGAPAPACRRTCARPRRSRRAWPGSPRRRRAAGPASPAPGGPAGPAARATASRPPLTRVAATSPRSQQMLYARSSAGRSLPAAGVHDGQGVQDGRRTDAEPEVPGDQPQQVAALQRGGLASSPVSRSSLRPWEPVPSARAISCRVSTTCSTCRLVGRSAARACSSASVAWPRSPAARTAATTSSSGTSVAVATARTASFSASPRSTAANSGATWPWQR